MAVRSRTWVDDAMLLPGETLVREAPARIRTQAPPGWWEGRLVLTSDRLFFLPQTDNPLLTEQLAFWLADVEETDGGRNRLRVHVIGSDAPGVTFQFLGPRLGPRGLLGERGRIWLYQIRRAKVHARAAYVFDEPKAPTPLPAERQQAAG
jgi:hypothetical protein